LKYSHPPSNSHFDKIKDFTNPNEKNNLSAPESAVKAKKQAAPKPAAHGEAIDRHGEDLKRLPAPQDGVNASADI